MSPQEPESQKGARKQLHFIINSIITGYQGILAHRKHFFHSGSELCRFPVGENLLFARIAVCPIYSVLDSVTRPGLLRSD